MRKLKAIVITAAVVATTTVVGAQAAYATFTTPAAGAVLAGSVTITDSGATDTGTLCLTGSSAKDTLTITSSTNTVTTLGTAGTGALSVTLDTHTLANGTYTLTATEQNRSGTILCSNKTVTVTESVRIDNVVNIAYNSATSAPQNTSISASATLTDPNLSTSVLPGRVLTFALSGGTTVSGTTGSNGVATVTLPISGPPRTATLSVSYAGTTFYDAKTQNVSFVVTQDPTSTTLGTLPTPSVHGQAVAFSATVAPTAGGGTPTGTVQFTDNGNNLGGAISVPSNGIVTTPAINTLTTGSHNIVATYSGDSNYLGSTSATGVQLVNKASTATALTGDNNPTVSGQAVTFTANVSVIGAGVGTPTGAVQFTIDGAPFGTAVPLTGTTATLTVSNLSVGSHPVQATYDGDPNFALSNSATLNQGVNQDTTTTTVASSDQSSVYGEGVTFTANVGANAPGAGTPTGSVQFSIDGTPFGNPVALVDGAATSGSTPGLGIGTHDITAAYLGDTNFSGSNGDITQTVNQDPTTTTVSSSVNPSVFGQGITFTANVSANAPGSGVPTGSVQFLIDGNPSGGPVGLVNGSATSDPVSDLEPGTYSVTVQYLGDTNFVASTSDALQQIVNKSATTVSVSSSANPSVFGQPVTFTATVAPVAPGAGSPTGTITFKDGTTVIGTAQTVNAGTGEQASVTTSSLVVAPHAISVTYSGDSDFLGSSNLLTQTVTRAQTSMIITSSDNPAASGEAVTFQATVTPVAPGAGNPTGTVSFTVNGAPLGGAATVTNGVATSTAFASLSPGSYTIAATYSGDGNFVGTQGVLAQGTGQNVNKGGTTETVTTSASPAPFSSTVIYTATVTDVAPATGKPTGVVDFYDGSYFLGASLLVQASSGNWSAAQFAVNSLSTGSHTITATYVGNFNFAGATASVAQSIGLEPTATTVTSSENPSVYTDSVTFTAVVNAASGTPTGTVTFTDGSTVIGTSPLAVLAGVDTATISTSAFGAGSHSITATYNGSNPFAGSSGHLTQVVAKANSTLTARSIITDQVALNRDGLLLDLTIGEASATLRGVGGAPLAGQTIAFTSTGAGGGTAPLCTATTNSNGYASCDVTLGNTVNTLALVITNGGYTATFAGNANYNGSTGSAGLDD